MNRRGAVIFVVLIVTVALAVGLVSLLSGVRGQSNTVRAIVDRHEQRLAARSAAYAIAAEIYLQRDSALAGQLPSLKESEDVLRVENLLVWQWQLVVDEKGKYLEPFASRLDVNHVSESTLRTFLETNDVASDHVLSHKPFHSLGSIRHAVGKSSDNDVNRSLTISSLDPQLRSGSGNQIGYLGAERIAVGSGASTPSGLSAEGDAFFQTISTGEWVPASASQILLRFQALAIPEEEWDIFLDAFDFGQGEPSYGLIDLSHATARVLAAIPGIDDAIAASFVDHRDSLSDDDLSGLTWPVRSGLVGVENYAMAIDQLTSRSLQFGVRYSVQHGNYDSVLFESNNMDTRPCEYELVIDISGDRPRVGYLRDVSSLRSRALPRMRSPESTEGQFDNSPEEIPEIRVDVVENGDSIDNKLVEKNTQWGRYPASGQQE
jgi:hypothetical protein